MKIKFCHVIDGANLNPLLYNAIKYSDRERFAYTVVSLEPANGLQEQMRELGVRSFSVDYRSRRDAPRTFWKLFRLFRRERFDVVQTHLFDASLIGLAAARLAGVPLRLFTGHHSHEVPLYNRPALTFVDGISGRWLADYSIAPSTDMKNIFIRHQKVPAAKIEVLPHGFDLEAWRASAEAATDDVRRELGLAGKTVFGAVGRLFWVKNFENLIRGFAPLAAGRDDLALVIAGGGDREKLQALIDELGLQGKVVLAGRREDIAAVMKSFDVFVHSALAESFGMVYIEVFALGKPVVSTPVGVAPDIIENGANGFLAEGVDAEALERAMRAALARRSDWPQMGARNRARAEDFAVRKTQGLCDNFYLKWLQEKKAG